MSGFSVARITPWVGRLMAAQLGVLVLLSTVFTAPTFLAALQFDPTAPLARPWTILTYQFVHAGPLHLGLSLLLLFIFGPAVEEKLGGRRFLALYQACALGTAAVAVGLSGMLELPPVLGASGAILGIALAFALLWPESELVIFPIPVPLSAATVLGMVVVLDLLGALRFAQDGTAHLAHLGGLITAYAWFRTQQRGRQREAPVSRPGRRPVMVTQMQVRQEERTAATSPPQPTARPEPTLSPRETERVELNRLLDKISADGIESLTADEQRFLRGVAERKKGDDH